MTANKHTPVDVLAALDREIEDARKRIPNLPPEGPIDAEQQTAYEEAGSAFVALSETRAAVAELIEADEAYDLARQAWLSSTSQHDFYIAARIAWKRRATALSRVRGAE